jgi:hypothetical protein
MKWNHEDRVLKRGGFLKIEKDGRVILQNPMAGPIEFPSREAWERERDELLTRGGGYSPRELLVIRPDWARGPSRPKPVPTPYDDLLPDAERALEEAIAAREEAAEQYFDAQDELAKMSRSYYVNDGHSYETVRPDFEEGKALRLQARIQQLRSEYEAASDGERQARVALNNLQRSASQYRQNGKQAK